MNQNRGDKGVDCHQENQNRGIIFTFTHHKGTSCWWVLRGKYYNGGEEEGGAKQAKPPGIH